MSHAKGHGQDNHQEHSAGNPSPTHAGAVGRLIPVHRIVRIAVLFDMGDASDADVREALGSGFPKHPLHKIACIGALVASRQPEGWRVDALGAPHTGERSEAQLIRDFIEKIGQLRPQLITFNGHSFDLPVLRYRAMVNRVPAAGLQVRQYFHRYTEDALDQYKLFFTWAAWRFLPHTHRSEVPSGYLRALRNGNESRPRCEHLQSLR